MIVDSDGRAHVVIDSHVHIGQRAAASGLIAGKSFPVETLLAEMDGAGIDRAVTFPRAFPTSDYREHNDYVIDSYRRYPSRIVPFVRIQPLFGSNAVADVHRYAALGARGLKIHPSIDGGNHPANSREVMFPVAEAAAADGLAILFHSSSHKACTPTLIADLADHVPDIPVIVGHCGLDLYEDALVAARRTPNLYLETSQIVGPGLINRLVRELGSGRVLFGSDAPAYPVAHELEKVSKYAGLSSDALSDVLGGNLARLLSLPATPPEASTAALAG